MSSAKHFLEQARGSACCETTGKILMPVDIALAKGSALAAPPTRVEQVPLMAAGKGFVFEIVAAIEAFGLLEALLRFAPVFVIEKITARGDQSDEFHRINPNRVAPQNI